MSELEKFKKHRTILRTAVTKLTNNIDAVLKADPLDLELLEEILNQLNLKAVDLKEIDSKLEPLFSGDEYEAELTATYDYADKISLMTFRAQKKLMENMKNVVIENNNSVSESLPTIANKSVKLPKLNMQKFYGDCTQYNNFWNMFKVSIHDNECLTKIEKFNYLRSYLSSSALNAIEGLEISELNYDVALKIIEERFGNKDMIINHHMNKLLNLSPVFKSSDISRLKKLHNDIEINVRSLTTLGLEPQSYSSMLLAIVLKLLPADLNLEYNRQNVKKSSIPDINKFLDFLQTEIKSREQSFAFSKPKAFENSKQQKYVKNPKLEFSSAHELMATVSDKQKSDKQKCLFCKQPHEPEICKTVPIDKKKNILKSEGRCFLCLKRKHLIKNCTSGLKCSGCLGKHNLTICFKSNPSNSNNSLTLSADKVEIESPEKGNSNEIITAISCTEKNKVFLQTCTAKIKNVNKEINIRLLLDCGSMRSFLIREVADKLKLKVIRKENLSVFTFGNKRPIQKIYDVVKIKLQNRSVPNSNLDIEVLVTDEISGSEILPPEISETKILQNLTLADTPYSKDPITLLVGADYYYSIVTGNIKHLNKNLVAVETIFGWCLQGKKGENQASLVLNVIVENNLISEQIKKFWDLETSGLFNTKQDHDPSENEILKNFESSIKYEDKRYIVNLPWKIDKHRLDDNRKIAESRLIKLNTRFVRNPQLFFDYKEVLNDYLKQGIIELVPNSENKENVEFYLPHREVIKSDRKTSKLRIVFDASSHEKNSLSLNDCLHTGPNLYPEIFDILLRFRLNSVAFTSDITQAFLQIYVNPENRDVSRFLFTDNPFDESDFPKVYRFTRVLFGVNCSPFLLAATIKYHIKKYADKYPETVKFLDENVYVDDVIGSRCSVEQALSTSLDSIKIFKEASMQLHKWHTNSKQLHELWKINGVISDENLETFECENVPNKVLGIAWNNVDDLLYFDIRELTAFVSKRIDTKRYILQVLGRVFDPIGFLGPFTLRVKFLMQKIWSLGIDWDDVIPEDLVLLWRNWCNEVPELSKFSVPRHYFFGISNDKVISLQLHLFSDASTLAYGTVAYLRVTTFKDEIRTIFVASKNRVAPLKTLTLPRLELMAALCSARLSCNILKALKLSIPCIYWTDSKITFFWIKGKPEKFKPFVKNRVEEIRKLTSPSDWHHCPGTENPADIVSRGAKVSKLRNDSIWLSGPKWLNLSPEFWPKSDNEEIVNENDLEYRKRQNDILQNECIVEELKNPIDVTKFSNLERLIRITALVLKFIKKIKKSAEVNNTLTTEDLLESENYLIMEEQKIFFKEEFESLINEKQIDKNSCLANFSPYLDDDKLMRLGGRLEFSDLQLEEKHPIILPKKSWLTTLIVRHEHEKIMHGGVAATLAKIRSKYWIPKGRQLVKSIIRKCIICKKYLSKPVDQITAPLPHDRINQASPFSVCGLDFAGPLYVRNSKEKQKSYIVLFTCGVTRAIHLELVANMTTESFLLAFRRFLSRRGNCKVIYSDNAKTFKKAKKEIDNLYDILSDNAFLSFLATKRLVWKNIIEKAAWWGGFYERLVKSVKECLRKIMGKALLSYEEMSTILVEVEAVLNLRPLTYVYSENDEPQPLTPMHFLNFGKEISIPINFFDVIQDGSKRSSLLKRKRYQSLLLKQLWSRWKKQYLLDLKTAHSQKNPTSHPPLKVGDVVLIEDDVKNKLLWKLGKIERTFLGRDNNIRSYEVKTANGLLKRTVQHLYPLELLD